MRRRLHFALVIVVVLLCVPAVTRAVQRLEPLAASPLASGLSRNCEAPPERVQISSPVAVLQIAQAADHLVRDATQHGRAFWTDVVLDEPLPVSLISSPHDSLRAPPSTLL